MSFRTMNGSSTRLEPLGEWNQNQKLRSYLHKRMLDPQTWLWNWEYKNRHTVDEHVVASSARNVVWPQRIEEWQETQSSVTLCSWGRGQAAALWHQKTGLECSRDLGPVHKCAHSGHRQSGSFKWATSHESLRVVNGFWACLIHPTDSPKISRETLRKGWHEGPESRRCSNQLAKFEWKCDLIGPHRLVRPGDIWLHPCQRGSVNRFRPTQLGGN